MNQLTIITLYFNCPLFIDQAQTCLILQRRNRRYLKSSPVNKAPTLAIVWYLVQIKTENRLLVVKKTVLTIPDHRKPFRLKLLSNILAMIGVDSVQLTRAKINF